MITIVAFVPGAIIAGIGALLLLVGEAALTGDFDFFA